MKTKTEWKPIFFQVWEPGQEAELPREGYFLIHWLTVDRPHSHDCLYLVPPYHAYYPDKKYRQGQLIGFSKEILSLEAQEFSMDVFQLFRKQDALATISPEEQTGNELKNILSVLACELEKENNFLLSRTLLKAFLLKLIGSTAKIFTAPNINEKRVHQFISLLESNFISNRNVSYYAASLNVSPKRLNQILKRKYNRTIHQIIHDRLIREAKHQLFISRKNIKEIAFDLGFEDKSYFSRFFKRMTGQTPEAFKMQIDRKVFLS